MGDNQTLISGHIEISGLGCNGKKLKGKTVSVFTVDGNVVSGEVIEANYIAVYIAESPERTRMIKASAIASISLSKDDAEQLRAKEKAFISPLVTSSKLR